MMAPQNANSKGFIEAAMIEIDALKIAMRRSNALSASICIALLTLTITSLTFAYVITGNARKIGPRNPEAVRSGDMGANGTPATLCETLPQ